MLRVESLFSPSLINQCSYFLSPQSPSGTRSESWCEDPSKPPRPQWQTVRSSAVRGQACHACLHTCPATGANFISYLWKRKSLSKPRALRFVWTTAGKRERKSEFLLMHTDDAEKLMLCNVYIIKRWVYNHLLRLEKWTREREGKRHTLYSECDRCKVEVTVRCFECCWLNIACHSLLRGRGALRHNGERWCRNVGIWWVRSDPRLGDREL